MAVKKTRRTSRTSKGLVGHPKKCKNHDGMKRLLNQQAAAKKGKNVRLIVDGKPAEWYWFYNES